MNRWEWIWNERKMVVQKSFDEQKNEEYHFSVCMHVGLYQGGGKEVERGTIDTLKSFSRNFSKESNSTKNARSIYTHLDNR